MKFNQSQNFEAAVEEIKLSMTPYYREHGLTWDDDKKLSRYKECELWEIVSAGEKVGFFMTLDRDNGLYLGELHIHEKYRNRGYGSEALKKIKKLASENGHTQIRVGAFKSSPAYKLYLTAGFSLEQETQYTYELVANT